MKKEEYEYWINKFEIEDREEGMNMDCNEDYVWNSWTHNYEPINDEHETDMDYSYEDYYHNKYDCEEYEYYREESEYLEECDDEVVPVSDDYWVCEDLMDSNLWYREYVKNNK